MAQQNSKVIEQVTQCIDLVKEVLGEALLGMYLYGSAIIGGLQKYSDIDLFVVSERDTTDKEKQKLADKLMQISDVYMLSEKLPVELTVVVKSEINPWHYPPKFDFQYGEWLRKEFESGIINPWQTKVMPDLAVLITQVSLASETLVGSHPDNLLCAVPYHDFLLATKGALQNLILELESDTRNVLLTYARIWCTVETDSIRSKLSAANWVMNRLPVEYQPVLQRAHSICIGESSEYWNDIQDLIRSCAKLMAEKINKRIMHIEKTAKANRVITISSE